MHGEESVCLPGNDSLDFVTEIAGQHRAAQVVPESSLELDAGIAWELEKRSRDSPRHRLNDKARLRRGCRSVG